MASASLFGAKATAPFCAPDGVLARWLNVAVRPNNRDGDCSFCKAWVGYWKDLTGDQVGYSPLQEVGERFPQMSHQQLTSAVQLVLDGEVRSGAYAVFTALAALPREQLRESRKHAAVKLLRQIPAIGPIRSALLVAFVRGQRTWSRLGSTSG